MSVYLAMIAISLGFQPGTGDKPPAIWEEIAHTEQLLRQAVNGKNSKFAVFSNDPIRGFYIERIGITIIVPLRYRVIVSRGRQETKPALPIQKNVSLEKNALQKQVRQWREKMKREELLKEADFEKAVNQLRDMVPQILAKLNHLPASESLNLIIEEREPAWFIASMSLNPNATRKVVTLSVDNQLIAKIHAKETVFPSDWKDKVKRTTTRRKLASLIP